MAYSSRSRRPRTPESSSSEAESSTDDDEADKLSKDQPMPAPFNQPIGRSMYDRNKDPLFPSEGN